MVYSATDPTIPLTKPWLPSFSDFKALAFDIFERRYVSNFAKYNELLEQKAGALLGHQFLAVSSCDIGMTLAWSALGNRSGEVIVPSFTFASTVNAIVWNNLTPVFADIDPRTLCLCPASVRERLTPATIGIAAVHLFGEPASQEIDRIAEQNGLSLLFDGAHAIGTTLGGYSLAGRGDAAVFSLSGTKVVTAGEGGLVTFADPAISRRFQELRNYGFIGDYNVKVTGLNGKMAELDAALGYLSLGMLEELVDARMAIADIYRRRLESTGLVRMQPVAFPGDSRSYKDIVVLFESGAQRAVVEQCLAAHKVETKRYFLPIHTMDAYKHLESTPLPCTESAWQTALCLPVYHDLPVDDVNRICDLVESVLNDVDRGTD